MLHDYGVTSKTTILKQGRAETVFAGGLAEYGQVYGSEFVSAGGKVIDDTTHSGGVMYVLLAAWPALRSSRAAA